MLKVKAKKSILVQEGVLRITGLIYIPRVYVLIRIIMEKAHNLKYSIHSGVVKTYDNLETTLLVV